jgi:hypothetical protein
MDQTFTAATSVREHVFVHDIDRSRCCGRDARACSAVLKVRRLTHAELGLAAGSTQRRREVVVSNSFKTEEKTVSRR